MREMIWKFRDLARSLGDQIYRQIGHRHIHSESKSKSVSLSLLSVVFSSLNSSLISCLAWQKYIPEFEAFLKLIRCLFEEDLTTKSCIYPSSYYYSKNTTRSPQAPAKRFERFIFSALQVLQVIFTMLARRMVSSAFPETIPISYSIEWLSA